MFLLNSYLSPLCAFWYVSVYIQDASETFLFGTFILSLSTFAATGFCLQKYLWLNITLLGDFRNHCVTQLNLTQINIHQFFMCSTERR